MKPGSTSFPQDSLHKLRPFVFISLTGGRYFPTPLKTDTLYCYWTPLRGLIHCANMTNGSRLTETSPLRRNPPWQRGTSRALDCRSSAFCFDKATLTGFYFLHTFFFGGGSTLVVGPCRRKMSPVGRLRLWPERALWKTLVKYHRWPSSSELPLLLWSAN